MECHKNEGGSVTDQDISKSINNSRQIIFLNDLIDENKAPVDNKPWEPRVILEFKNGTYKLLARMRTKWGKWRNKKDGSLHNLYLAETSTGNYLVKNGRIILYNQSSNSCIQDRLLSTSEIEPYRLKLGTFDGWILQSQGLLRFLVNNNARPMLTLGSGSRNINARLEFKQSGLQQLYETKDSPMEDFLLLGCFNENFVSFTPNEFLLRPEEASGPDVQCGKESISVPIQRT